MGGYNLVAGFLIFFFVFIYFVWFGTSLIIENNKEKKDNIKINPYGEWNHLVLKVDHNQNIGSITFNGQKVYDFPLYGPEWDEMVNRSKFSGDSYFENLTLNLT